MTQFEPQAILINTINCQGGHKNCPHIVKLEVTGLPTHLAHRVIGYYLSSNHNHLGFYDHGHILSEAFRGTIEQALQVDTDQYTDLEPFSEAKLSAYDRCDGEWQQIA